MSLSCQIIIERDQSQFPVTVIIDDVDTGHFDHPTNPSGDQKYILTEAEQHEAMKLLYPDDIRADQEPEPALCGPAASECADRAAANWRSERLSR